MQATARTPGTRVRVDATRAGRGPEAMADTIDADLRRAGLDRAVPAAVLRVVADLLTRLIEADEAATERRR